MNHKRTYTSKAVALQQSQNNFLAILVMMVTVLAMLVVNTAHARGVPDDFSGVVEKVYPAVGNVLVTVRGDNNSSDIEKFLEQLPKEYRDQYRKRLAPDGDDKPRFGMAQGSAFLISADGYMVTNNHVVKSAEKIVVTLNGSDKQYTAKIIGTDSKTDLALLKIERNKPFPYVKFGDSDAMKMGNWVIAVGNPMGFGGTVTAGIISADGRYLGNGPYDNYIQTDTAINRGNSGGPLFNMDGDVIGVNTLIISSTGQSSGLGFAVPSKQVKQVINQLKQYGTTRRGWLGVSIQHVSDAIAETLGMKKTYGALVQGLHPKGPSLKAGIKMGDVIIKFDGKEVPSNTALPRMVANTAVNKTVPVVVWRDGKEVTVKITLGELEKADIDVAHNGSVTEQSEKATPQKTNDFGLSLAPYNRELAAQYDLPKTGIKGLVITGVDKTGIAGKAGLSEGLIISHVNKTPVATPDDFDKAIKTAKKLKRKSVLLRIGDGTRSRYMVLKWEK